MEPSEKPKKGFGYYLVFGGLVINLFFLIKVVPTFRDVFLSFGGPLPPLTTICIRVSNHLQFLNPPVAPFIVVFFVYGLLFPFYEKGRFKPKWPKEWMIILLLGILAGIVVIAIFMPMFELGNTVKK
ncbi:MAG TPA: hypothetical protein VIJ93_11645 [bacterium]